MGTNCTTDQYNGCRFNVGDGKCHHPRREQGSRLPTYKPGEYCLWGEVPLDYADVLRAMSATRNHNRRTSK